MSNPFIGEIRMFGGNFAPYQWALCNGQIMSIAQNQALFSLIGTIYGGDGIQTFALPNLQGRLALGYGQGPGLSNYDLGQAAGSETVTLLISDMPGHYHSLVATTTAADQTSATGHLTGKPANGAIMYVNPGSPSPTLGDLNVLSCGNAGGNQPHENLMPAQCVTYIISLSGIFPSRN